MFVPELEVATDFLDEIEGILAEVHIIKRNFDGVMRAQMEVVMTNGQRAIVAANRKTAEKEGCEGGRRYTFPLGIGHPFAVRTVFVPTVSKSGNLTESKHYLMPDTRKGDAVDLAHTPTLAEYLASDYPGKPATPVEADDLEGGVKF